MKTREQVEALKQDWDGSWDLHATEGFEEYADELRQYEADQEAKWRARAQREVEAKAAALGCPDNHKLAEYILHLEMRINDMRQEIEDLKDSVHEAHCAATIQSQVSRFSGR